MTGTKSKRSGYRGVSWYPRYGVWRAQVQFKGKRIHLGYFHDVHDAGIAASDFRLQHAAEIAKVQEEGRRRKADSFKAYLANLSPEEQRDRVRNNFLNATCEERSARSRKGWRTKRKATERAARHA